ncbi:MAG: glycoside hydrolase family 2 TIM barrel-domain containing protein [Phycisphaerae bacterium]|nr:glycoside hydrolase family 2 TIM barrel-domain containing protein [Phycisphaerae bacterium]
MAKEILDLAGQWRFKKYPVEARRMRDLEEGDWLNCVVPSSIYADLAEAGVIERAKLESNPEDFFDISLEPWIYKKQFDLSDSFLASEKIELVFDGLDTFAQVWLNGKLLGRTDNMFRQWRFDVAAIVRGRCNELLVKFDSAVEEGERLMNRYGMLSKDKCSLPQRAYVRKAQCQFGWDWSPALPGCGIWKDVRLEGIGAGSISDVHITTVDCGKTSADIKIFVEIEKFSSRPMVCELSVSDAAGKIAAKTKLQFGARHKQASAVVKIAKPQLWQPRGYGAQPLYKLTAELHEGEKIIDSVTQNFGIRTVKLNQVPDEYGQSFQFEINGKPVYVKGANWIPASLFVGSAREDEYERLLVSAAEANINMLRVWGGGVYETEDFYDICDRLGILVWQDFMFACAYYPDRAWFFESVKKEASQNIVRLRNHPSLVLWCGNNEIDWQHSSGSLGRSKKFYGRSIYHKILPQLVHELDPSRDYIPSTPLGPGKNPNDMSVGTVHQWQVWSGLKSSDDYLSGVPRFTAEFGFQSLPCKKTIQNLVGDERIAGLSLEKHNYQPNGTGRLQYYMNELFRPPADIDEFVYLSQITQARAVRKNVEHLRANSEINSGVMFWQFNDCCPAVSWSCVDYGGRKKSLYYYARRFYAPVIVMASAQYRQERPQKKNIESLTVSVVNHSVSPLTGLLLCRMVDINFEIIDEFKMPVSAGPDSAMKILLPQSFASPKRAESSFVQILLENGDDVIAENSFFYQPDKYFDFPAMDVDIKTKKVSELEWELTVKGKKMVKDLCIDCAFDCDLSDNYFDLLDNKPKSITIKTYTPIDEIKDKITFVSVNSIFLKT